MVRLRRKIADRDPLKPFDQAQVDPAQNALIDPRRIHKAVADDPLAGRQRRQDRALHVVVAGGGKQHRLHLRPEWLCRAREQILIPERPFDIDKVAESIRQRHERGRYFSIIVVAEGAKFAPTGGSSDVISQDMGKDEFGHAKLGGIANVLAREIEKRTGFETRAVVLGHIQRGGSPSAFDRVLATRYGLGAIDMVHRGEFGCMAALRANKIISISLKEAISKNRVVDNEMIEIVDGLFEEIGVKETASK